MHRAKLLVACALTLVGCSTSEMARRAEIQKVEADVRAAIKRLVDLEKFLDACQYQPGKYDKPYLNEAAERAKTAEIQGHVYPRWVEWNERKINAEVARLVDGRKFGEAREYIWQYGNTGVADVDVQVDGIRYRLLAEKVNVTELEFMRKDMTASYEAALKENTIDALVAARKKIVKYPEVRTYSSALDGSLDRVRDELIAVKVPEAKLDPILERTRSMISDCFVDRKSNVRVSEGPDLTGSRSRLSEFQADLMKYGCNAKQAERVAGAFAKEVKPILDAAVQAAKDASVVALGTSSVNDRAESIRKELLVKIDEKVIGTLTAELLKDVKGELARQNPDFPRLRKRILAFRPVGDPSLDAEYLTIRIGVLNTLVNPAQCEYQIAEMKAVAARPESPEMAGDTNKYNKAHQALLAMRPADDAEAYADVCSALVAVGKVMRELNISAVDSDSYIRRKTNELLEDLNKRKQGFAEQSKRDMRRLVVSLKKYEEELAHHFSGKDGNEVAKRKGAVWNDVQAMLKTGNRCMTTEEMNSRILSCNIALRKKIIPFMGKERAEAERLAKEDDHRAKLDRAGASYSAADQTHQLQVALRQIAQQRSENPWGRDDANALLAEYARLQRLDLETVQKDGMRLSTLLAGSVYLGQDSAFKVFLDLTDGADDINRVPESDPRKRTALLFALEFCHPEMFEALDRAGADFNVQDAHGNGALHYAAKGGETAVIEAVADKVDIDSTNHVGETALFFAARANDKFMVNELVGMIKDESKRLAFVNRSNAAKLTAFDIACSNGCLAAMQALSGLKATFDGGTLAVAAAGDQLDAVRWLVEHGVSVNSPGVMGMVPEGSKTEEYLVSQGGIRVARVGSGKSRDAKGAGKAKYVLCEIPDEIDGAAMKRTGEKEGGPAK